jgi:hypothetical protein
MGLKGVQSEAGQSSYSCALRRLTTNSRLLCSANSMADKMSNERTNEPAQMLAVVGQLILT